MKLEMELENVMPIFITDDFEYDKIYLLLVNKNEITREDLQNEVDRIKNFYQEYYNDTPSYIDLLELLQDKFEHNIYKVYDIKYNYNNYKVDEVFF